MLFNIFPRKMDSGIRVHPQQVCRWHYAERCSWHAGEKVCHPEGPWLSWKGGQVQTLSCTSVGTIPNTGWEKLVLLYIVLTQWSARDKLHKMAHSFKESKGYYVSLCIAPPEPLSIIAGLGLPLSWKKEPSEVQLLQLLACRLDLS